MTSKCFLGFFDPLLVHKILLAPKIGAFFTPLPLGRGRHIWKGPLTHVHGNAIPPSASKKAPRENGEKPSDRAMRA